MSDPAYIELTRAFYRRVLGAPKIGDDKQPSSFETASMPEYMDAVAHLGKVARFLGGAKIATTIQNGKKPDSRWTTLRAQTGDVFTVRFKAAKTRPQAVTETSRAAYRTLDFSTSQGAVLNAIYGATLNGLDITRAEIAALLQMEKSSVSGRVNELMKMSEAQPFKINGKYYRISDTDKRRSNLPDATVKNEAFRLVECAPYNFKPAAEVAQTQLFI